MSVKIVKKSPQPLMAQVDMELKEGGKTLAEEHKQEPVPYTPKAEPAAAPWCEVGFEASFTKNLGGFQSARVGVSLKIPCKHAEINQVYDIARTWVDERLGKCVAELQGDGEGIN